MKAMSTWLAAGLLLALPALSPAAETYSDDEVVKAASDFFSTGAKELGTVLQKVLKEKGQPVAFIKGEEAGGAAVIGFRYGHGELLYKGETTGRKVYWQGPSFGLDFGGNAVKVFALVYNMPDGSRIFRRFGGVEGSLYFVGGFGMNYMQAGQYAIAPVRFGVGWRQGVAFQYMKFTEKRTANPF